MQNAKLILEAANRYNKALENNSPMDQADAMNIFQDSLTRFVMEALKDLKKKGTQPRAAFVY